MPDITIEMGRQLPPGTLIKYVENGDGTHAPAFYVQQPVDVSIQDQTTPIVNVNLHQDLGSITLAAPTTAGSRIIELEAGHGTSAGELIYLREGVGFCQAIVTNVAVNTITLDTPVGCVFSTATLGVRAQANLNVNGSSTPVTFHVQPPPLVPAWDITRVVLAIVDNLEMDDTKFGAITGGLTNGVVLRKNNGDGTYTNIGNAKTNGQLRLLCEQGEYADQAGVGNYGFNVKCVFQPAVGVTVRLDPSLKEELELIVQDDLTPLVSLLVVAQGHVVVN